MEVIVFTECPTKDYYRALRRIKGKVEFRDSRFFYLCFLFIYSRFGSLRILAHDFLGKPLHVKKVKFSTLWNSFFSYFELLFTKKKVVVLFAPYSWMGVYLWLLKKFKKDLVYMTSWPFWNGRDYVFKPNWIKMFFWERFLRNVKAVTISDTARKGLLRYTKNVVQIPHAVDLEVFKPCKKLDKFTVLFTGRLVREKGIKDILEIAKELPEIDFRFAGSGSMESEVRDCTLPNVKFFGRISDRDELAKVFGESSVFVLNSFKIKGWEELYGIVLLESLSCGTAVISTDCVGPKEIVGKEYGFLVGQRDKEALKEKIVWCSQNKDKVFAMGKKGREFVEGKYGVSRLTEEWSRVLDSI